VAEYFPEDTLCTNCKINPGLSMLLFYLGLLTL